jgi:hypothetical protein
MSTHLNTIMSTDIESYKCILLDSSNFDFKKYAEKYNNINSTNYDFTGDIKIEKFEQIIYVNINLVIHDNYKTIYNNVKQFTIIDNKINKSFYNNKTISMDCYHLIDIVDEIVNIVN